MTFLIELLVLITRAGTASVNTVQKAGRIIMALGAARKRKVILESVRLVVLQTSKKHASVILTYTAIEAIPDIIIAVRTQADDNSVAKTRADAWREVAVSMTDIGWLGTFALVVWGGSAFVVNKRDISLFAKMQQARKGNKPKPPSKGGGSMGAPGGGDKPVTGPFQPGSKFKGNLPRNSQHNPNVMNNINGNGDGYSVKIRSFFSAMAAKGQKIYTLGGEMNVAAFIKGWNRNTGSTEQSKKFLQFIKNSEDSGRFFAFVKGNKQGERIGQKLFNIVDGKGVLILGSGIALTAAWFYFISSNLDSLLKTFKSNSDMLNDVIQEVGSITKNEVLSRHITPFYNLNVEHGTEAFQMSSDEISNKINLFKLLHIELLDYNSHFKNGEGIEHVGHLISAVEKVLELYNAYDREFFDYIFPIVQTVKLVNEDIRAQNSHTLGEYLNPDGSFILGDNMNDFDPEQLNLDLGINDNPSQIKPNLPANQKGKQTTLSNLNPEQQHVVVDDEPVFTADLNLKDLNIAVKGRA